MKPTSAPQADVVEAPVTSFMLLCFASYLMSLAYGVTFLIPILVSQHGGDESLAGLIIASATITTVLSVIVSGHLADTLGAVRCIAAAGIVLVLSGVGFAIAGGALWLLLASALVLGCGWGTFYTLGPILVAAITKPQRRTHFFALLSGSMMTGIGTGPILGRVVTSLGLPIEFAFIIAAASSVLGVIIFFYLHGTFKHLGIAIRGNKITFSSARSVVSSRALYPIVMVGLGGSLFGSISSFQTSYALERGYDYSLFFIGFISAAILCRLFLSGTIVRLEPHLTSFALTSLMVISILMFIYIDFGNFGYILSAAVLGVGYGLTYSVINGLAATEAPSGYVPQSLLLFSLAYFIGVFGFPLIAGNLITGYGVNTMLFATLAVAGVNSVIPLARLIKGHSEAQQTT